MKLSLENVGKFKKANIEINGITVIAGANNTGKSTLGKTLYCIFTAMNDIENKCKNEKVRFIQNEIDKFISGLNSGSDENGYRAFWNRDYYIDINNLDEPDFVDDVINKIISKHKTVDKSKLLALQEDLRRVFAFDISNFAGFVLGDYINDEFKNQFTNVKHRKSFIRFEVAKKEYEIKVESGVPKIKNLFHSFSEAIYIDNPFVIDGKNDFLMLMRDRFLRDSFMHQERLYRLFHNSFKANDKFSEILYDEKSKNVIEKISMAAKGTIVENSSEKMFLETGYKKPFHLKNLSSGLKTFVIFKQLLENRSINDGDVLILDEPEIHLHPEWQLLLAEIVVILQKEFGLHVLLTTHSPYFINAIEVFSAKYKIADKTKYYLTDINKEQYAFIEDVTTDTNKIYYLLAEPLKRLAVYGLNDSTISKK